MFIKSMLRTLYRNSTLLRRWWFWLNFVKNNRYIPNFKNPKTYNEKINHRKNDPKHELFSICADKIAAKDYVAAKISPDIIIPNYYVGDDISFKKVKSILDEKGDCLLKANHNSGPVYLLTTQSTDKEIKHAVDDVNHQLTIDFGKLQNETWYSDIQPGVLVEKRLFPEEGESDVKDYKFHVFKQNDGSVKIVLGVYFNRGANATASFFDEHLIWLPFHGEFPSLVTKINKPKNYETMLDYAKKIAVEFSYVRVDFYNVNGHIYFGEMTFAHTSGGGAFSSKSYDLWMGNLWQGDPRY